MVIHHAKKHYEGQELTPNSSRGSNAILANFVCQIAIDQPDPKSEWRRVQVLKENLGVRPQPVGFLASDKGLQFGAAPIRPPKERKETERKGRRMSPSLGSRSLC